MTYKGYEITKRDKVLGGYEFVNPKDGMVWLTTTSKKAKEIIDREIERKEKSEITKD